MSSIGSEVALDMEDDAWSYSFPASSESLSIEETHPSESTEGDDSAVNFYTVKENFSDSENIEKVLGSAELQAKPNLNESPLATPPQPISQPAAPALTSRLSTSYNSSRSTGSSLGPVISSKSTPADPETTKHDIHSTTVASPTSLKVETSTLEDSPSTPTASFFSTFKSAASSFQGLASPTTKSHNRTISDISIDSTSPASPSGLLSNPIPEEGQLVQTPEMVSYRRSRRRKSTTNSTSSKDTAAAVSAAALALRGTGLADTPPKTSDFDRSHYIDERFLDTQYRYATLKRNSDFHELFKSVPEDDRLLDDFSCALSKELLLQGRLYVSEHHVCFNSNLFGWVTNLVIPLAEIKSFEKRVTAGLFSNGINIEVADAKYSFASFISRDSTLNFLETVWSKTAKIDGPVSGVSEKKTLQEQFESEILSIDEDSDETKSNDYENIGPSTHEPTTLDVALEANEKVVVNETLSAPLGLVYNMMFGPKTDFHKHIIELNDGSKFSEYSRFENDVRSYKFERKLNYTIGPKSANCEVEEHILTYDLDKGIVVITKTKTPNVPSGNAFVVNTRYVFTWGENNSTQLQISYFIDWVGRSWVKGMIESETATGQTKFGETVVEQYRIELANCSSSYIADTSETETLSKSTVSAPVASQPVVAVTKPPVDATKMLLYAVLIMQFIILLGLAKLNWNLNRLRDQYEKSHLMSDYKNL